MKILRSIGERQQTDKALPICFGQSYLDIYERYFEPMRERVRNVLEFGVAAGGSLRTWEEYFPHAQIVGVDVNPDAQQRTTSRTRILTCSQDDAWQLHALATDFDIIVDDGSHINDLTVASFNIMFPRVREGGYYIIEDMGLTHDTDVASDTVRGGWPGMQYNRQGLNLINKRPQIDALLNPLIAAMDRDQGEIEFMHFWSKTLIIKKRI